MRVPSKQFTRQFTAMSIAATSNHQADQEKESTVGFFYPQSPVSALGLEAQKRQRTPLSSASDLRCCPVPIFGSIPTFSGHLLQPEPSRRRPPPVSASHL